jgi:hypothetical protein
VLSDEGRDLEGVPFIWPVACEVKYIKCVNSKAARKQAIVGGVSRPSKNLFYFIFNISLLIFYLLFIYFLKLLFILSRV